MQQRMRLLTIMMTLGGLALALTPLFAPRAAAQDAQRCFDETGFCISGRFLEYWQQNGGLPVFGYPISPAREGNNADGTTVLIQYFERQRFELHPENAPPYDVLLGLLGTISVQQYSPNDPVRQREEGPRAGCLWFAETGFNVCDEQGFATYWQQNGLLDPALDSYQQSLALFGYPISQLIEVDQNGITHIQVFERARFEYHPNNPDPFKVQLARLGTEALERRPEPPGIGRVTYVTDDGLYTISVDGSNQARILAPTTLGDAPYQLTDPRWSPDASKIAFVAALPGDQPPSLYVINADGSYPTRIAENAVNPDWSPDGTRIVYNRISPPTPDATSEIVVANADGSNATALTTEQSFAFDPRWSPDGSQIAYRATRRGVEPSTVPQLYVINADGSDQRQLSQDGASAFDWSPDGQSVAFASFTDGQTNNNLTIAAADGSTSRQLAITPAVLQDPRWSPDGAQIAFVRRTSTNSNSDIFVINADGNDERALITEPEEVFDPVWVSGGSVLSLLYTARDSTGEAIYRVVGDGSTRLTNGRDPDFTRR